MVLAIVLFFASDEFLSLLASVFDLFVCLLLLTLKHGHSVSEQLDILLDPKIDLRNYNNFAY